MIDFQLRKVIECLLNNILISELLSSQVLNNIFIEDKFLLSMQIEMLENENCNVSFWDTSRSH